MDRVYGPEPSDCFGYGHALSGCVTYPLCSHSRDASPLVHSHFRTFPFSAGNSDSENKGTSASIFVSGTWITDVSDHQMARHVYVKLMYYCSSHMSHPILDSVKTCLQPNNQFLLRRRRRVKLDFHVSASASAMNAPIGISRCDTLIARCSPICECSLSS